MDDNISLFGNPRTLQAHKEMQMRDVQRGQATSRIHAADRAGLHTALVVGTNERGDVMLDRFTDDQGKGSYFSSLNFTPCRNGDTVIYAYADEVPIVLGRMPDDKTPWRVPQWSMQDTFHFEDFDTAAAGASGIGILDWVITAPSGSGFPFSGFANNPGMIQLTTGTTVGSYSYTYPKPQYGLQTDSLHQVGFMVFPSNILLTCQVISGLTDNVVNYTNYIAAIAGPGSGGVDAQWNFCSRKASGTQHCVISNVPFIDNHYYRIVFTRISPGVWAMSITDTSTKVEDTVINSGCPSDINAAPLFPTSRIYMTNASAAKTLWLDYVWWSRRALLR
jgi:hypothetical protein